MRAGANVRFGCSASARCRGKTDVEGGRRSNAGAALTATFSPKQALDGNSQALNTFSWLRWEMVWQVAVSKTNMML